MDSPKQPPAALRYFFARFKPLAQPKWWVPSSLIALGGISAWLYWNHPEWLGGALFPSQPQSAAPNLEAPAGNLLDDPLEKLTVDFPGTTSATPTPNPISPSNPLASPLINPLGGSGSPEKAPASNPLDQLTQSPANPGKSQFSQIFSPLIPSFKEAPVPTASDLLKPIAPPPASAQIPGLPLPATSVTPQQEARQQLPTNSGETGIPTEQPGLQQPTANQPQPVTPTYPTYGAGIPAQSPGATYPPPYYTYGGQPVPISPPPYYNTQPPAANPQPQQPYYGGQPVVPNQPYQGNPNQPNQGNPNRQPQRSPFDARIFRSF
jgi:hypothetical protein